MIFIYHMQTILRRLSNENTKEHFYDKKTNIFIVIAFVVFLPNCVDQYINKKTRDYIIPKQNEHIILVYKAFDDFLKSDRSWKNYQNILLKAYPEMQIVHGRQLKWGAIDPAKFPEDLKNYNRKDFEHFFNQYHSCPK